MGQAASVERAGVEGVIQARSMYNTEYTELGLWPHSNDDGKIVTQANAHGPIYSKA